MAASKKNKQIYETLSLEGELLNCVSYSTYYNRIPLFTSFRLFNGGEQDMENLTVTISGSNRLILPAQITVGKISAQSSVEVKTPSLLNPKYLAEREQPEVCTVTVDVSCGKDGICSLSSDVTAISMESWSGLSGNAEMIAAFVRPRLSDCQKILAEAGLQLKTWGFSKEWSGYAGNDKNAVMYAFASVFSAVRNLNIERGEAADPTQIIEIGNLAEIVNEKMATPLAMAIFTASCLEAARLNPVILVGKSKIGVGVWLYESCFNTTLLDDMSVVERYVSAGVDNLAIVDADDLFAHKNASFTTSASHFTTALYSDKFESLIDVKRCRIGGIFPMPIKIGKGSAYEILGDKQFSYEAKPESLINADKLALAGKATKDRSWERRLLDLSMKNNLLCFRYNKDCVHLLISDPDDLVTKLRDGVSLTLLHNQTRIEDARYFGSGEGIRNLGELIRIELSSGIVRAYSGEQALAENVQTLIRKGKATQEEVGANTLYLALGFLQWKRKDEKEFKYAPIVLLPVNVKKIKNQGIILEFGEDFTVNTTLFEFLHQEFGIDIRGLEDETLSPRKIIAVVRSRTSDMRGWLVHEDVYLAQFTFAGYAMWKDVRENMNIYKRNPLIASLLSNANMFEDNRRRAPRKGAHAAALRFLAVLSRGGVLPRHDVRAARTSRHGQKPDDNQHDSERPRRGQTRALRGGKTRRSGSREKQIKRHRAR